MAQKRLSFESFSYRMVLSVGRSEAALPKTEFTSLLAQSTVTESHSKRCTLCHVSHGNESSKKHLMRYYACMCFSGLAVRTFVKFSRRPGHMLGGGHQKRAAPWESAPAAHRATKPLVGRLYPQAGPLVHWNWDNFGDTGRRARSQRVVAHHPLAGGGHGVSLGGMYPPHAPS